MAFKEEMTKCAEGHWTREMPQKEGHYTGRALNPGGNVDLYIYKDGDTFKSTHAWGAWWWSEPIPEFPPAPDML